MNVKERLGGLVVLKQNPPNSRRVFDIFICNIYFAPFGVPYLLSSLFALSALPTK